MILVTVGKIGENPFSEKVADMEAANAFVEQIYATGVLGQKERTIEDEQGNEIVLPADFTVSYEDITDQANFEAELAESETYVADIQKGTKAIAFFRLLNDKKGLTAEQKNAALADVNLQKIMQLLSLGKLPEAKYLISNFAADGVIVTESDKLKLVRFLES